MEERERNWSMAIGLQDVDRLKPSGFCLKRLIRSISRERFQARMSVIVLRNTLLSTKNGQ